MTSPQPIAKRLTDEQRRTFIIYTSEWDDESGGAIALHRLCDLLNRQGHSAYLWPWQRPARRHRRRTPSELGRDLHRAAVGLLRPFRTHAGFLTPVAQHKHLRNAVVVYPEVIDGNPLGARFVVRWLLHRPGFHTGRTHYGHDDLFFFYQHAFNDPSLNPHDDHLLQTYFVRDDIYHHQHLGARDGTCHMVRKGEVTQLHHDPDESLLVDGLSHESAAAVFNVRRRFISYDTYTLYSQYAALCGCESIVVPRKGTQKFEWFADERDRYGIAYGFADEELEWAAETRPLLLPYLKSKERRANQSVDRFVRTCVAYFG